MFKRTQTKLVKVGNIIIGGKNDVVIQSMLTIKTEHIEKCLQKINDLYEIGCEIIRVSCFDKKDVDALKIISKKSPMPVVADIHYNGQYAIDAVKNGVSKIRINPGNIGKDKIKEIVKICKEKNIPIRIGVNIGSLQPEIFLRYGFTAKSMVESIKRNVKIIEDLDYNNIVLSVKSSDPYMTIKAYKQIAKLYNYPLHIGITEAGSLNRAIIKSSCALGKLLELGIGDTIRISISDDPKHEVNAAKELLRYYKLKKNIPNLISCPTCGRLNYDMLPLVKEIENFLEKIRGDITVAIMGCTVNGPGEAKAADIALCGEIDSAHIYIDGKFKRTLVNEEIIPEFKQEILDYLKNKPKIK